MTTNKTPPSSKNELLEELIRKIENYLQKNYVGSLSSLARDSGIPYRTLRRISQGENVPDLSSVMALLNVISSQEEAQRFLAKHFPNTFQIFQSTFFQNPVPESSSILPCDDNLSFEMMRMVATKKDCTKDDMRKSFGDYGMQQLEKIISAGYITENDGVLTFLGLEMSSNVQICLQNIRLLAQLFPQENLSTSKALLGSLSNTIDQEGLKKIKQYSVEFQQKIKKITTANPGDIPVYIAWLHNTYDLDKI